MAVLGVAVLRTDLMACSYILRPISDGTRSQGVVIGTVTQADRLSTEIQVETVLKSEPSTDILSLVTTVSPSSSCFSALDVLYRVGHRYLLMLPAKNAEGKYKAPVYAPWRVGLGAEPSEEENLFIEYVNYAIEHERSPISFSIEGPSEFMAGKPIPIQLTLSNHTAVPLSMFDQDTPAQPAHLRFGLDVCSQKGECFLDEAPLEADTVIVLPDESMIIEIDLAQVYGIKDPGTYDVLGVFVDLPLAPGRIYRDEFPEFTSPSYLTFTVISEDTSVSEVSWGSVKSVCCR